MSRWLQNVGTFLERLDDQAERVAEEERGGESGEAMAASIMAARGFQDEDDGEEDVVVDDDDDDLALAENDQAEEFLQESNQQEVQQAQNDPETATEAAMPFELSTPLQDRGDDDTEKEDLSEFVDAAEFKSPEKSRPIVAESKESSSRNAQEQADGSSNDLSPNNSAPQQKSSAEEATAQQSSETPPEEGTDNALTRPSSAPIPTEASEESPGKEASAPLTAEAKLPTFLSAAAPLLAAATSSRMEPKKSEITANNNASTGNAKELRTLRRSVVSLHQQLQAAETELQAQRQELERAAARMETDRTQHKEKLATEKQKYANELKVLQQKHQEALREAQARADQQMEQLRAQLRAVEDKRMQEGGDWDKELRDSVEREKEISAKFRCAEEEKETLLNQIAILQSQQESLGSRVESLSQTADNAMEREREAEQRLDEALTLHAKQISQRQAREAELERTIAELGLALVQARNQAAPKAENGDSGGSQGKLQSAEHEIESLRNQLQYESQRASSLLVELEVLSRERTQEATTNHKQQRQYEREVSSLKEKIAQMEAELVTFKGDPESGVRRGGSFKEDPDTLRQIKQLSEEVLRQREKITNSSSELSALKSRLQLATERAIKAEAALETAQFGNSDGVQDVEIGPSMRRRRRGRSPKPETIRSALQLDALAHNNSAEQIGKALDGLDSFLLQSGKILRYQPVARLFFILYLIMIHLWTFFLIFVHAHGYETVHGDFGAGQGVPHGPHALMMHSPEVASSHLEQADAHN